LRILNYFFILLLINLLYADIDSDLDGVEDSKDLCPNSKITDIVDKNGCSIERLKLPKEHHIDISLGYVYKKYSDYSSKYNTFAMIYYYGEYSLNLYLTSNSEDDIESSLSYSKINNNFLYSITLGAYFPTTSDNKIDYFAKLGFSYINDYNLFVNLEYDFMQDSNSKNGYILSFGIGKNLNDNLYGSLSYKYNCALYDDENSNKYLTFILNYDFNSNWYISSSFGLGLDNSSPKKEVSFNLGYYY